jgi:hypothetical protein
MGFNMASLLIYSEQVPEAVRVTLEAARHGPPARRLELLESAAHILHYEAGVTCLDALELVDLSPDGGCNQM